MLGTLTALGTLALMAGWFQPVSAVSGAMAHPIFEAAAVSFAQLPGKLTAERSTVTAKKSESLADVSSRLETANQQLDQQDQLIQRALDAAQKAARDAAIVQNDPAASPAARDQAAARFKQATDLIARLKAMRDRLTQNKQQVSELKARKPSFAIGEIASRPVPKDYSESVARLEDSQRLSIAETQQTANFAFTLQASTDVKSATPPGSDEKPEDRGGQPTAVSPAPVPMPAPPPPAPKTENPVATQSGGGAGPGSVPGSGAGPPQPTSGAGPSSSPPTTVPPSLADQVSGWFAQLQQGNLDYKVPTTMYWKESSTVTVRIQGPHSGASSALPNASGSGSVKVSDRMKIVLSSPENPDDFIITREEGTDDIQFVPADGYTTWNWSVTPKYTGRSKKLSVNAWVLYPGPDDKVRLELPVYSANIDVHVPGLGESLKRLLEGDPDYWLKYGLPGGGGFIFVAGALAGLRKWAASRKSKSDKTLTPSAK